MVAAPRCSVTLMLLDCTLACATDPAGTDAGSGRGAFPDVRHKAMHSVYVVPKGPVGIRLRPGAATRRHFFGRAADGGGQSIVSQQTIVCRCELHTLDGKVEGAPKPNKAKGPVSMPPHVSNGGSEGSASFSTLKSR